MGSIPITRSTVVHEVNPHRLPLVVAVGLNFVADDCEQFRGNPHSSPDVRVIFVALKGVNNPFLSLEWFLTWRKCLLDRKYSDVAGAHSNGKPEVRAKGLRSRAVVPVIIGSCSKIRQWQRSQDDSAVRSELKEISNAGHEKNSRPVARCPAQCIGSWMARAAMLACAVVSKCSVVMVSSFSMIYVACPTADNLLDGLVRQASAGAAVQAFDWTRL